LEPHLLNARAKAQGGAGERNIFTIRISRLPNHVRRLKRVRRRVNGKALLYHLHLLSLGK
jgi:hypothetical protein